MSDAGLASDAAGLPMQSSPGATLAATRQAYGLTVTEIANHLNLSSSQVIALETDDYAALPVPAIARGFLRSYAKLLRLDPVPLLAMLGPVVLPGDVSLTTPAQSPVTPPAQHRKTVFMVAGVIALVTAAVASYAMGWLPDAVIGNSQPDQSDAVATHHSDKINPVIGRGLASNSLSGDVPPTSQTAGNVADALNMPVVPMAGRELLPAVSIGVLEQSIDGSLLKSQAMQSSGTATNPLVLSVHKDSWVELKRADNSAVVATVLKGGSVETFDVSEPLTLTIGNAAGVQASLRGTPLMLAGVGNGNVARMKLK